MMLQKTLMTVGASLTAVVFLLFMIQRKKPRPVAGKSDGETGAGQVNNNDAGTRKAIKTACKSDGSGGKITEAVTVAPNGLVVKTDVNSKEEEEVSGDQSGHMVQVETLEKVQELSEAPSVEMASQESLCEEGSLQQSLEQAKPSNADESACTLQNSGKVSNVSAIEQNSPNADQQCHELLTVRDVAVASDPVEECPVQQQEEVNKLSEEQQSTNLDDKQDDGKLSKSPSVAEVPIPASSEQSTSEENKSEIQTKAVVQVCNLSTDQSESPEVEQKFQDTEQEKEDTIKHEVEIVPVEITPNENLVANNNSSSREMITIDSEQHSSTESPSLSKSHRLSLQNTSEQSNGGLVKENLQTLSEQANGNSSHLESLPPNGELTKRASCSESSQSNGGPDKSVSCSESGQSNGKSVEKVSNSESEQGNGESIKDSTDTIGQSNGGSQESAGVVEHYYDNHKIVVPGKSNLSYQRRGDCRKLWQQPEDGLVFVKGSPGQPLVPQYLRDVDYLTNRTIPAHDPASTAYLYTHMNKLAYPPENWVRVISVSDNLELRVRHDERDMLLEQLERRGICDPQAKPPPPRMLAVGSLVAAHLNVPRRGLIWCRAHITAVVPVTGPSGRRKGRQPQPQHQPQPLFMVESIDHFPAASPEPVRASDLRVLATHAQQAPFYDQLFYLLNTMPADAVEYGPSARSLLLEQLRAGHNFLRVSGPALYTFVSGACYWMASLAAVQTREAGSAVCLLEEALQQSEHAMAIYSGRVLEGLPFNKCIFRDAEAFWSDDDRCPSSLLPSCGPPNPQQEYLWLRRTDPRIIQAFRGFKLPYKHAKHQFKRMGFSMSLHEYYTVYRHHSSTVLLTADPDKVLRVVLDDPQALVILDFHMQTLIRFYHFDPSVMEDPEAHVARNNTPMHMLSFPKDDNGFLIFGNTFFADFTIDNLRIPIMPF